MLFRHDGIPVILMPFLAIQNNSRGRHLRVASTRYGGAGSIPLTQRSRATADAPWQATQCASYAQKPAATWAALALAGASMALAWLRTEWIMVSCVSHSVNLVWGLDAATS